MKPSGQYGIVSVGADFSNAQAATRRGTCGGRLLAAVMIAGTTVNAVEPATVRSLHAIHLGTPLQSRPGLISFVTYDKRLLDAAQTAGLPVNSPA